MDRDLRAVRWKVKQHRLGKGKKMQKRQQGEGLDMVRSRLVV